MPSSTLEIDTNSGIAEAKAALGLALSSPYIVETDEGRHSVSIPEIRTLVLRRDMWHARSIHEPDISLVRYYKQQADELQLKINHLHWLETDLLSKISWARRQLELALAKAANTEATARQAVDRVEANLAETRQHMLSAARRHIETRTPGQHAEAIYRREATGAPHNLVFRPSIIRDWGQAGGKVYTVGSPDYPGILTVFFDADGQEVRHQWDKRRRKR